PLGEVNQEAAIRLREKILRPDASPSAYTRHVVTPLRSILNHAHDLGWCDAPRIKAPKQSEGRTRFLLPAEAERLIEADASHLQPILVFLLCTGARMSEALELEWRDVDLEGGRVILWKTKTGRRRVAGLPPRAMAALAGLPTVRAGFFSPTEVCLTGRPNATPEPRSKHHGGARFAVPDSIPN